MCAAVPRGHASGVCVCVCYVCFVLLHVLCATTDGGEVGVPILGGVRGDESPQVGLMFGELIVFAKRLGPPVSGWVGRSAGSGVRVGAELPVEGTRTRACVWGSSEWVLEVWAALARNNTQDEKGGCARTLRKSMRARRVLREGRVG